MAIENLETKQAYGRAMAFEVDETTVVTVYDATQVPVENQTAEFYFGVVAEGEVGVEFYPTSQNKRRIIIVVGDHTLTPESTKLLMEIGG